jgi:bile acid:Na+ symporter, BASS family
MVEPLAEILTYGFLISTMLAIGLTVTREEILNAMEDRRRMGRVFLANLVLVPVLAYLLMAIIPLPPGTKLALALLALAPGGLTAIQFTDKVKGHLAFAAAVAFLLTLLSIVITPVLIKILIPLQTGLHLPFVRIILFVILFLLLPLIMGFAIRGRYEKGAVVLSKLMLIVSNIFFVAMILFTSAAKKEAMRSVGKETILVMLLFVVFCMVIGWSTGGSHRGNRRVLAIVTSMRNAGLCLVVALRSFPASGADVAVIAFMGLMVPPNMLFTLYHVIREKLRGRKAGSSKTPGPQGPAGLDDFPKSSHP